MINDCSPNTDCKYQNLIDEYSKYITITYLETETNSGPGIARQLGLDNATADWIWFQDDDDEIYAENSLEELLSLMYWNDCKYSDIFAITGSTYCCYIDIDKKDHVQPNYITLQGSLINREFLAKNNIHFEPSLSYKEEDATFKSLMLSKVTTERVLQYEADVPMYKKKWRSDECLTAVVSPLDSYFAMIGVRTLSASYEFGKDMTSNKQCRISISDCLICVPLLVHNLIGFLEVNNLTLTQSQYESLEKYIGIYQEIFTQFDIDLSKEIEEGLQQSYLKDLFNDDSFYGQISEDVLYTFLDKIPLYLATLQTYVV